LGTLPEVLVGGQVGGFELEPSVFPSWEPAPQGPVIEASIAGVQHGPVFHEEGGPIEIEAVLSRHASLAMSESSEAVAGKPVKNAPEETHDSIRVALSAPANADGISSELARAMVFELAGGEPSGTVRPAQTDRDGAAATRDVVPESKAREPLSFIDRRTHGIPATDVDHLRSPVALAVAQANDVAGPLTELLSGMRNAIQYAFDRFVDRTQDLTGAGGGNELSVDAGVNAASVEAFEQLTEEEAASASLGLDLSLSGALNATPFLMILALERIAASNSRRANRDERCPTTVALRRAKP
jgi:hypothetical protein